MIERIETVETEIAKGVRTIVNEADDFVRRHPLLVACLAFMACALDVLLIFGVRV